MKYQSIFEPFRFPCLKNSALQSAYSSPLHVFTWQSQSCFLHPGDSLRPFPTQIEGPLKPLLVDFLYKLPVLVHALNFSKISQRFTNPKQKASGLIISFTSC